MKKPAHTPGDSPSPGDSSLHGDLPRASHSPGRRTVLVAMPAILSLHQGVAAQVARTSAVLVKSETETLLCAGDPGLGGNEKGWFVPNEGPIDVTRFDADRTYCKLAGTNPGGNPLYTEVQPREMCSTGGTYYYSPNNNCNNAQNLVETNVNHDTRGAFVSALSIASFGVRVNYIDV